LNQKKRRTARHFLKTLAGTHLSPRQAPLQGHTRALFTLAPLSHSSDHPRNLRLQPKLVAFPSHIFPHIPTSSRDLVENSWDPIPVILVSVIQSVNFLPWPAIADCRPLRAVQHWTLWTPVDGRARANFRWCCVEAPGHVRCCFQHYAIDIIVKQSVENCIW